MSLPAKVLWKSSAQPGALIWLSLTLVLVLFCAGCVGVAAPDVRNAVPTVSIIITSPVAGATVSGTTTIMASVSASATSVQFMVDGTTLGAAVTSAPFSYSLNTTSLSNGNHLLTAVANAAGGQTAASAPISVKVNNANPVPLAAPSVSITSPASGASVSGTITVTASVSANANSVQFMVDGISAGPAVTSAPFGFSLNTTTLSNGSHLLTAVASTVGGQTAASAAISIKVNNANPVPPAPAPPSVSITSPVPGATVSGTIAVTASVSANTTSVQFMVDGNTVAAVANAPFSLSLNTTTLSNASHSLTARASTSAGQTATSAAISIKVNNANPVPPTPPSVSITSPTSGATVSGTITVTVSVSANTTSVQFNVDGTSAGPAVTNAPFSFSLNTTKLSNASHLLTAVAGTAGGQTTTGVGVSIKVNNANPVPPAPPPPPPPPPPAASRGATLPYVEYEAENASYTGTLIGPSRNLNDMAAEASGREAVKLTATGQHVTFTATQPANSIVVRYSIPDSATGTGINATLSIYVNGAFQQKLLITSRYSWAYDRLAYQNPKVPNAATAHHFYDEAHTLLKQIPAGATVTLQEDADDTAPYYVIDLIDLEQVGPPIPQPAGSLSITDCGADPSGANDSSTAIENCINLAESHAEVLYIPQGTFKTLGGRLHANNVTVQGAGMWYSALSGIGAGFLCGGGDCKFLDLALLGDATFRSDTNKTGGFDGTSGPGSVIDGVWVEHANNGYWVGHNTNGLIVRNSRVRDTFADGVNFNCGTTNSIVENTELRYTGDNGTGVSSRASCGNGPTTNNTFKFNTVQLPWNAQCFNVFGGGDNTFEDNLCYDTIIEPGFLVAQAFTTTPFTGTTSILRTTLIRAGGPYGGKDGALTIEPREGPLAAGNILIQNLDIENALFSGIEFKGPFAMSNVSVDGVTVSGAGTWGVQVDGPANGTATMSGVVVSNAASGGLHNAAGAAFNIIRGPGNVGW